MVLAITEVFEAGGLPCGLSLLLVVLAHFGLLMTTEASRSRPIFGVAPFNIAIALLVIFAAYVEQPWKWLFWVAAGTIPFVAAALRRAAGRAINLAGGVAPYLGGDVAFRKILRPGPGGMRLLVAALLLLTIPLGLLLGPLVQLAACVLLLQVLWPIERKIDTRNSTH